jgi:hypothetical protein
VAEGDVVEIEVGRTARPRRGDPGAMNRAIAVRESFADDTGECRWDPEDERLWMRVLNCNWMQAEGWQLERGLDTKWFKPAPSGG